VKKQVTHNSNSEYRRISFVGGLSKEHHFQIGQEIRAEKAFVYEIKETSRSIDNSKFILRYTIYLINDQGVVYPWYEVVEPINLVLQRSHEELI